GSDLNKVGVVANQTQVAEAFIQMKEGDYQFVAVADQKEAEKQLQAEKIDAYLTLEVTDDKVAGTLYSESSVGNTLQMTIQQLLNSVQRSARSQALGLTAAEVAQLDTPATFTTQKTSFNEAGEVEDKDDYSNLQSVV